MSDPQSDRKPGTGAFVLSFALKGCGLICFIAAVFSFGLMNSHENGPLIRIAFGFVTGVLIAGGVMIVRFSKRLTSQAAAALLSADKRPPVLYLRSFKDDDVMDQTNSGTPIIPSLTTEEEQLAAAFRGFGPFVAVGLPSEDMSQAGAARFRFHESEWRDRVLELMDQARLVVLRIGATEGLAWEISMSAWRVPPGKLLLLIPGSRPLYEEFVNTAGPRFRKPLPAFQVAKKKPPPGTVRAIVRFSQDWDPQFMPLTVPRLRAGKPLTVALQSVLREAAEATGVSWRPPRYSWIKIGAVIMLPLLILYSILSGHANTKAPSHRSSTAVGSYETKTFETLKSLQGDWAIQSKGKTLPIKMSYELGSKGSIITEQFGKELSVFYRDGQSLDLTHFCNRGNQPRLRLKENSQPGVLEFEMFDIANLANASHVQRIIYRITDSKNMDIEIVWQTGKTEESEKYTLTRI